VYRKSKEVYMPDWNELATRKDFLRPLAENPGQLPADAEPFAFLKALLPNLGSTDAEPRDTLTSPSMLHILLDGQERDHLTPSLPTGALPARRYAWHISKSGSPRS
jgi:hypothetical protein